MLYSAIVYKVSDIMYLTSSHVKPTTAAIIFQTFSVLSETFMPLENKPSTHVMVHVGSCDFTRRQRRRHV